MAVLHNPAWRHLRRSASFAAFALIVSMLPFDSPGIPLSIADAGPSPVEVYLVPLPEKDIRVGSLALYSGTSDEVHTVISGTGAIDGTIVPYDH